MLLAYLRGLLEPKYDQGLRSILRESLIIEALSMELDAQYVGIQTQVHASYASLLAPKNASELIAKQQVTLQNLRHLAEFDDRITGIDEATAQSEQADLFELYMAMEEAHLVGEDAIAIPEPENKR